MTIQSKLRCYDEVVRHWAERAPERLAFEFYGDGENLSERLSYAELDLRARKVAAALQERGLAGEPVLLQYRPSLEFVTSFLGCLYARAIAVPAYPPARNRSKSDRLHKLIADCGALAVLTDSATARDLKQEQTSLLSENALLISDQLDPELARAWRASVPDPSTIAFLQYSSGSTGDPKGVIVKHSNILSNQAAIQAGMRTGSESVIASWLPLFHDMGLIGNVLHPLYLGVGCYMMPPIAFIQNPRRWLRMVSEHRVTVTGGPNFAYDMCVQRVPPEQRSGLDLSSWEVAYNGAEPVRAATLRRFTDAYRGHGFDARSFYPCYGLAESTLFVSGPEAQVEPALISVDAGALSQGRVEPATGEGARELVPCGVIWGGQRVVIVEPDTKRALPEGRVGEIWIAGDSVCGGYWRRTDANDESFAQLSGDTGAGLFFRSGDLGFMRRGQLFVTGRLKELLIVRGRNHYPQDIELSVQQAWSGFVPGGGAAFVCDEEAGDRLVLVQEIARQGIASYDPQTVLELARKAVADSHGLMLSELIAIRPGTLPRTSSGKTRRRFVRAAHLGQGLAEITLTPAGAV